MGLHDLRRLPRGLPGLHRPPPQDPADALPHRPQRRVGPDAGRADHHVRQHRELEQPVGPAAGGPHAVGRRSRRPDRRGQARRGVPAVRRLRRRLQRRQPRRPPARSSSAWTRPASTSRCSAPRRTAPGDTLRRGGNEASFQTLAEQNVELIERSTRSGRSSRAARTASTRWATSTRSSAATTRSSTTPSSSPTSSSRASSRSTRRWARRPPTTTAATSGAGTRSTTSPAPRSRRRSAARATSWSSGATASTASAAARVGPACGWRRSPRSGSTSTAPRR